MMKTDFETIGGGQATWNQYGLGTGDTIDRIENV